MKLAFGTLFLWTGAALIALASRGIEASTPWGAYQTILSRIRASGEGED